MADKFPPRTRWFGMAFKPTREGEYEGRQKGSGAVLVIHWRILHDTTRPGWYFAKGQLGPFNCWQAADLEITAWRGLSAPCKQKGTQDNV